MSELIFHNTVIEIVVCNFNSRGEQRPRWQMNCYFFSTTGWNKEADYNLCHNLLKLLYSLAYTACLIVSRISVYEKFSVWVYSITQRLCIYLEAFPEQPWLLNCLLQAILNKTTETYQTHQCPQLVYVWITLTKSVFTTGDEGVRWPLFQIGWLLLHSKVDFETLSLLIREKAYSFFAFYS